MTCMRASAAVRSGSRFPKSPTPHPGGTVRAFLGTKEAGRIVDLELRNLAGQPQVSLGLVAYGAPTPGAALVPGLMIGTHTGAQATIVGGPDGALGFGMFKLDRSGGQGAVSINLDADGKPSMQVLGERAQVLWQAP
jgi:hypothetical protein